MKLSPRQQQVLELILQGLNNQQIADKLGITKGTLQGYIKTIYIVEGVYKKANPRQILINKYIK